MEFDLDPGWSLAPVGGTTGGAFMGVYAHEKYFLKRNASPFLAALSLEGVTPKLIWTKRMATGDVVTAQEWLNGRTLTRGEMTAPQVAELLARVHGSALLRTMLKKVGGQAQQPAHLRGRVVSDLPPALRQHPLIVRSVAEIGTLPPTTDAIRVCHGDLNHKNWLLSDAGRLYLVDWDQASIGDIAYDLSVVLINYVPRRLWAGWLRNYGQPLDTALMDRIRWYGQLHLLSEIKANYRTQHYTAMNHALIQLQALLDH